MIRFSDDLSPPIHQTKGIDPFASIITIYIAEEILDKKF